MCLDASPARSPHRACAPGCRGGASVCRDCARRLHRCVYCRAPLRGPDDQAPDDAEDALREIRQNDTVFMVLITLWFLTCVLVMYTTEVMRRVAEGGRLDDPEYALGVPLAV